MEASAYLSDRGAEASRMLTCTMYACTYFVNMCIWLFPKIRSPILVVAIIRIIVIWVYLRPPIYGNPHMYMCILYVAGSKVCEQQPYI